MSLPNLYPWQKREIIDHCLQPKRAIFASPRVGKSLAAVVGMKSWLDASGNRGPGIVVAPLTVCPQWDALLTQAGFKTIVGYGIPGAALSRVLEAPRPPYRPSVLVLSDSLLDRVTEKALKFLGTEGAFVADESHRFAGVSTKRGRAMRKLATKAKWVRLLSGTPVPNHVGNLWGQMTAIDPDAWGRSYERWAREYLIRDAMFPSKVLGVRNSDKLREMVLRSASIVRREDVFGPDSWQTIVRDVELPPKARQQYNTLAKRWVLDEPHLTVENTAVRLLRLQQITSGSVPNEDGEPVHLHDAKIEAVIADLEDIVLAGEKAVIFYRFVNEGKRMLDAINKQYPSIGALRLGGDTTGPERERVFSSIETSEGAAIAVVQLQSGGVGRSFAEATYVMFLSEDFSFAGHEQARDRIYKPGARRVAISYRCKGTVDAYVGKVLEGKRNVHDALRECDLREVVFG